MWTSKLGNKYPKEDIERSDSKHHSILNALRKEPANSACAECGDVGTSWASVNLGVFVCVRCSDVHRALGTHVSKVKGCSGTYLWGPDEIQNMQRLGNAAAEARYGGRCSAARPAASASKEERVKMCRRKYEDLEWAAARDAGVVEGSNNNSPSFTSVVSTILTHSAAATVLSSPTLSDSGAKGRVSSGPPKPPALRTTDRIETGDKDRLFAEDPRGGGQCQAKNAAGGLDLDFEDFFGEMGLADPSPPSAPRRELQQAASGYLPSKVVASPVVPSLNPQPTMDSAQQEKESLEQCFPSAAQHESAGPAASFRPANFRAAGGSTSAQQFGGNNLWNDFGAW